MWRASCNMRSDQPCLYCILLLSDDAKAFTSLFPYFYRFQYSPDHKMYCLEKKKSFAANQLGDSCRFAISWVLSFGNSIILRSMVYSNGMTGRLEIYRSRKSLPDYTQLSSFLHRNILNSVTLWISYRIRSGDQRAPLCIIHVLLCFSPYRPQPYDTPTPHAFPTDRRN